MKNLYANIKLFLQDCRTFFTMNANYVLAEVLTSPGKTREFFLTGKIRENPGNFFILFQNLLFSLLYLPFTPFDFIPSFNIYHFSL